MNPATIAMRILAIDSPYGASLSETRFWCFTDSSGFPHDFKPGQAASSPHHTGDGVRTWRA